MTKSADYGMFHEDAYIVQSGTSYRYVTTLTGKWIFHYCQKGQRLDDTRAFVRRNIHDLKIQDRLFLSQPWQCECEVESRLQVEPVIAPVVSNPTILINGHKVEGSIDMLRQLLGIQ